MFFHGHLLWNITQTALNVLVKVLWKAQNEFKNHCSCHWNIYFSKQWKSNYDCDSKLTCLLCTVLNESFWEKGSSTHIAIHYSQLTGSQQGQDFKTQGRPLQAIPQAFRAVGKRGGSGGGAAPQLQQPAVLARVAQSRAGRTGMVPLLHLGTHCLLCLHAPNTQVI